MQVFCSPNKLVLVFELMENDLRKCSHLKVWKSPGRSLEGMTWMQYKDVRLLGEERECLVLFG